MQKPKVIIVNEQDEIVGYKTREELNAGDLDKIYRVTALWLTNSKGEILLAQRKLTKKHDPGKWGPAAAGTLEEGDTYDSNIVNEIWEELGLKDLKLTKATKYRVSDYYNYFGQWYTATIDKPAGDFIIQEEEVEQVKWFTREELAQELKNNPQNYLDLSYPLTAFTK